MFVQIIMANELDENIFSSPKERQRLTEAGILPKVLDQAMMQFILEIIVNHGHEAKFLCNKDPFTLKATVYAISFMLLLNLFSYNNLGICTNFFQMLSLF